MHNYSDLTHLLAGIVAGVLVGLMSAGYALTSHPRSPATHWHAKGCPGQGNLVYHADHLDEFPEGCKEFVVVLDKTDAPVKSFWTDEIPLNTVG